MRTVKLHFAKILSAFLILLFAVQPLCLAIAPRTSPEKFLQSFLDNYEFTDGRFTREYHPLLLEQTALYFKDLETAIREDGIEIDGRIVIAGYEEGALPNYHTDALTSGIDDEATVQTEHGWSMRLHNQSGVLTGFLFRDVNSLQSPPFAHHVDVDEVEVFSAGDIFCEHAFGKTYPTLQHFKQKVTELCSWQDAKGLFEVLSTFWRYLHENDIRLPSGHFAATQDIKFSIGYADYLKASEVPTLAYFTGPDITYPIETFQAQEASATHHAQSFVPKLLSQLKARGGKPTAYVFCSFVDGVGKSTMLGNVQNYVTYGEDVESYERVDNSSSQFAAMYKLDEDVYIADLPAQVSHVTYKPDGDVYVDVQTELAHEKILALNKHVRQNIESIEAAYKDMWKEVLKVIASDGIMAQALSDRDAPHLAYIKNCFLLSSPDKNQWLPFSYEDRHYLVNPGQDVQIRLLRPLGGASSSGLKNIEAEQMLFFDGVRFPLSYDIFLDDLMTKLRDRGIERVVLVDFLSQYPRSQRENIRINYLFQQLALLHGEFDISKSPYKHLVHPAQMFADLHRPAERKVMEESLRQETQLRYNLYDILNERHETLDGVPLEQLTSKLSSRRQPFNIADLDDRVHEKCQNEYLILKSIWEHAKELHNIQLFSFELAVYFSQELAALFTHRAQGSRLGRLWEGLEGIVVEGDEPSDPMDGSLMHLSNGLEVRAFFSFHPSCRDEAQLEPFLQMSRLAWYTSLLNVLCGFEERAFMMPYVLLPGVNGRIYAVTKLFEADEQRSSMCGFFEDVSYPIKVENCPTDSGEFGFDYHSSDPDTLFRLSVSDIVYAYGDVLMADNPEIGDPVCPTSHVLEVLAGKPEFAQQLKRAAEIAIPFGQTSQKRKPIYEGRDDQRACARLYVRYLATLEMVMRDPDSTIIVRMGSREDFAAALVLIEKLIMPKYLRILFKKPLFDDYTAVKPIIPWEIIDAHFG